ncbi:MAG: hypothetical protein HY909_16540 [Deltaproteobacteria bacterium]|nr:hypothetical protein [Deltaproteobacteria bacterium]
MKTDRATHKAHTLDEDAGRHGPRAVFTAVVEAARERAPSLKGRWRAQVAAWAAYALRYNTRFEIDHSTDPPWDCSGRLVRTDERFDPAECSTLRDLWDEPNGQTRATYTSGYGMHHITFGDELEEAAREATYAFLEDVGMDHAREHALDYLSALDEETRSWADTAERAFWALDEQCGEQVLDLQVRLSWQWVEEAQSFIVSELLSEGAFSARRRRQLEEAAQASASRDAEARLGLARDALERLEREYQRRIGPFPRRHHFSKGDACWPALRALLATWSPEDRGLLVGVLPCSHSIEAFLRSSTE